MGLKPDHGAPPRRRSDWHLIDRMATQTADWTARGGELHIHGASPGLNILNAVGSRHWPDFGFAVNDSYQLLPSLTHIWDSQTV
jgi:hypothetical protein